MTTSGLTHHVKHMLKLSENVLDLFTPLFWNSSEFLSDFNFGLFSVKRKQQDIVINLQVKDIKNNLRLSKTIMVKRDLQF